MRCASVRAASGARAKPNVIERLAAMASATLSRQDAANRNAKSFSDSGRATRASGDESIAPSLSFSA